MEIVVHEKHYIKWIEQITKIQVLWNENFINYPEQQN